MTKFHFFYLHTSSIPKATNATESEPEPSDFGGDKNAFGRGWKPKINPRLILTFLILTAAAAAEDGGREVQNENPIAAPAAALGSIFTTESVFRLFTQQRMSAYSLRHTDVANVNE